MVKFKNTLMIFALILAVSLTSCSSSGTSYIPSGDVSLSSATSQRTPKGALVQSLSGVSDAHLALVDDGLTKAFSDGMASGYPDNGKIYNYGFYIIQIPSKPCVLSPENKTPSFIVRGDNYDGSVYDQYNSRGELPKDQQTDFNKYVKDGIGTVYAAEMVTGFGTEGSTTNGAPQVNASFVVCDSDSTLKDGTDYGAEHVIIAHSDTDYYNETATHSTKPHPLLPKAKAFGFKNFAPRVAVARRLVDPAK